VIRQLPVLALAAVTAVSLFGAERVRSVRPGALAPAAGNDAARSLVRAAAAARRSPSAAKSRSAAAAASATAPGVVQINIFDSAREAYFVCTETIPAGTYFQAFVVLPGGNEFALDSLKATEDLPAGYSLILPAIRSLGDFWQQGLTTYYVVVTSADGTQTMSASDFGTLGYYRTYSDTQYMVPGIDSYSEALSEDGSTIVTLKGRFVADTPAYVAVEDMVVPADAITVSSSTTIVFNLSKAVGNYWDSSAGAYTQTSYDTTTMRHSLLTVGQSAWADTIPFRHTPLQ